MIGAYIEASTHHHEILELEKTSNPCCNTTELRINTLNSFDNIKKCVADFDALLFHYYCHPLIIRALFAVLGVEKTAIVAWCHNNGLSELQPLPDELGDLVDSVVLSGCEDPRFHDCDVIRPIPNQQDLVQVSIESKNKRYDQLPTFRYLGSLDGTKIHSCAKNWFNIIKKDYEFAIYTLDQEHDFNEYKIFQGITERKLVYDDYFCAVYPMRPDHYGCGELGLQELLMLGYPVILRENSVELSITKDLSGVYFANSDEEFRRKMTMVRHDWGAILDHWDNRSRENTERIIARAPYEKLDLHLKKISATFRKRVKAADLMNGVELMMFAYNCKTYVDLCNVLEMWKSSGRFEIERKSSPKQFVKYYSSAGMDFPESLCEDSYFS